MTKQEIMEVFLMPRELYEREIMAPAFELLKERKG